MAPTASAAPCPARTASFRDWLILGTATQYHTVQDHVKAKLAYDFSPTVRATYVLGLWQNDSEGRPASYLRNGAGQPVYSGPVTIAGRSYTLGQTDFNVSNEELRHVMHGLTVKSFTKGEFDWELAASLYDYADDTLRAATVALPGALNGGAGRIVDGSGTGWNTFAAKGIWRPQGQGGAHIVEFGYQREAYKLASIEHATADWINGAPGARNAAFGGRTQTQALYAQDTWRFAPQWKAVLGMRLERWEASEGRTSNAVTTVAHPERHGTYASPKAALAYQATPDWTVKASVGRAVRMPTVSELYQGGVNGVGVLINNDPNLAPERSWTGELTAERKLETGSLRLTAFGERTTRRLVFADECAGDAERDECPERRAASIPRASSWPTARPMFAAGPRPERQPDLDRFDDRTQRQVPGQRGQAPAAHSGMARDRRGQLPRQRAPGADAGCALQRRAVLDAG